MVKTLWLYVFTVGVLTGGAIVLQAQTNDLSAPSLAVSADREQATLEKHLKPIMTALGLRDTNQVAKVRAIITVQLARLNAWHGQNDLQIKALWNEFNQARGKQDQTNADLSLAKLETVYASFKPQHDQFISELASVLTPDQVETVEDALTINKVKITFHAYGEIFPGLTDAQNAFILKNLKQAREEAIDAGTMPEKSAFFKKYKIRIEAYLTAQGFDVKKAYQVFVAKQKSEIADKKPSGTTTEAQKP